jgi:hypothetical protein
MATIRGILSISGTLSTLLPNGELLLLAGFPDPQQASSAATDFIKNVKGIPSGTLVDVIGNPVPTAPGEQPEIVMSDINPVPKAEPNAPQTQGTSTSQN